MDKIFELTRLAQLMDAVMDETDGQVFSFMFNSSGEPSFAVRPNFFYENFKGFRVDYDSAAEELPFRLSKEIGGVVFQCYVDDLSGLKHLKNQPIKRHKKSLRALQCG